jgi:hypothetical protein
MNAQLRPKGRLSAAALLAAALTVAALPAAADDIDQINQLVQTEFRLLSEDIAAAASYKAVIPAEPLGTTGFDLGFEVTATKLQNESAWDRASSGSAPSTVYVPKVHVHKGLPFGLDVGAFYAVVPDSNIALWGAALRYAILAGGVAQPALGLRATYTQLTGVDQLDFNTTGLELTISKGFAFITPYAGLGRVWVKSTPVGVSNIQPEDFSLGKYYLGANINLAVLNIAVEADKTGEATSYNVKLGWRF